MEGVFNKKILINNELPLKLLSVNNNLNDYDFILYHLFVKEPSYRRFFLNNKKLQRMSILDNSAYEFYKSGEKFNEAAFIKTIEELRPTYCIVPDVLMDSQKTIQLFDTWSSIETGLTRKMVVPQGKSFREWLDCYTTMVQKGGFDYIGIPFHNDFFWDLGISKLSVNCDLAQNKDYFYAMGRICVLRFLEEHDFIVPGMKYHLLGSHWAPALQIINSYRKNTSLFKWITSIDTSYPVSKGIERRSLINSDHRKEEIGIDMFFHCPIDEEQETYIINNIERYHSYVEN